LCLKKNLVVVAEFVVEAGVEGGEVNAEPVREFLLQSDTP
jgi:hypothetical protein